MTDKEKIKAEIERLKDVDVTEFPNTNWVKGRNFALTRLEVFIDAMQEEPVSEDLETEIEFYMKNHLKWNSDALRASIESWGIKIARHFANWQRQQMMAEAVDGQLENGEDYLRIKCLSMGCQPQDDGKLVKLIIIKEDGV